MLERLARGNFQRKLVGMTASSEQRVPLIEDAETGNRFLVYATERGADVELLYGGDTFWASQAQMAEMFDVTRQNITNAPQKHF